MARRVGPFNWNVPIVNPNGTPTKEFMAKWLQQTAVNGSIPALSTAAEVSAVLDVLGGTRGDLLVRGSSSWGTVGSPSDATKFLSGSLDPDWSFVLDSDISVADNTDNNVSTSAHGFAPKLSGTATEYLDGSGAFSTPTGASVEQLAHSIDISGNDTTNTATQGITFHPTAAISISSLYMPVNPPTGATYVASILTLASDAAGASVSAVSLGTTVTPPVTAVRQWLKLPFSSPVSLSAGTIYGIGLTRTDGTNTSPVNIGSGGGFLSPGPWWQKAFYNLNQKTPAAGQTLSGYVAGFSFGAGFAGTW